MTVDGGGYHIGVEYRPRHVFLIVVPAVVWAVGAAIWLLLGRFTPVLMWATFQAAYAGLLMWRIRDRYRWIVRTEPEGVDLRRRYGELLRVPWSAVESARVRRGRLVLRARLDLNPWDRMLAGRVQPDGTVEVACLVWGLRPRLTAATVTGWVHENRIPVHNRQPTADR